MAGPGGPCAGRSGARLPGRHRLRRRPRGARHLRSALYRAGAVRHQSRPSSSTLPPIPPSTRRRPIRSGHSPSTATGRACWPRQPSAAAFPSSTFGPTTSSTGASTTRTWRTTQRRRPPSSAAPSSRARQRCATPNPRHVILRTSWIFSPGGRNFVKTMLAQAAEQQRVRVVDDQRGSPTYAPHLVTIILELARRLSKPGANGPWGVYHAANSGTTTWNDILPRKRPPLARAGWPGGQGRPTPSPARTIRRLRRAR